MDYEVDAIRKLCAGAPGFDSGNAKERARIACRVLTEQGFAIPSWERLRDIIERGSGGDISEGVKAFRREHGAMLKRLGGAGQGVPEALGDAFRKLWEQALTAARQGFAAESEKLQSERDDALQQAVEARANGERAEARVRELLAQLDAAAAAQDALRVEVQAERAAREQAERMFEKNEQEIAAQRDELREALKAAQEDWRKSLDRLDGERRHAMLQIDEARTKAQRDVESARQTAQRARDDAELEAARSNTAMQDLRQRLSAAEARNAASQQEAQELRARVARAEAQADALSAAAATHEVPPGETRRGHRIRPARGAGNGQVKPAPRRTSR